MCSHLNPFASGNAVASGRRAYVLVYLVGLGTVSATCVIAQMSILDHLVWEKVLSWKKSFYVGMPKY